MIELPPIPDVDRPAVDVDAFHQSMDEAGVGAVVPMGLRTFLEDLSGRWEQIHAAATERDPAGLRRAAHALKSSAGSIHAGRLHVLLSHLEHAAFEERMEDCERLAFMIGDEMERVRAQLADSMEAT